MRRRRLLILLAILFVLPLGAGLGLRVYLASEWGRQRVEAELTQAIGARVELGGVSAGVFSTSLHELKVFLDGDADTPTISVAEIDIALPLWRLLDESAVLRKLTLDGAAITLRFDRAGRILIQPPRKDGDGFQELLVRLENTRFTLRQLGKPDLQAEGIAATLRGKDGKLILKGTATDPSWGKWSLLGLVETASGAASVQIQTDEVVVTPERLVGMPFVDAEVWEEVMADGVSSVELKVWHVPGEEIAHYRVKLQPRQARLRVSAIDLDASDVTGKVVIEDGRVTLRNMTASAADGKLAVQGDLNFQTKPEQLRFSLQATGLDIRRLPAAWNIPDFLEGRLTGQAELGIDLLGAGIRTLGEGKGQIIEARIAGSPTAEPVAMSLVSAGQGFRFQTAPPRPGWWIQFDSDVANVVAGTLRHVGQAFAAAGRGITDWRLARRDTRQPTYLQFHVDLQEVDLGRFLIGVGIPLAVPVEGRAAIDVRLDLPMDTLDEPKCYRLEGTVRVPWLKVDDLEFHDVLRQAELPGRRAPRDRPERSRRRSLRRHGLAGIGADRQTGCQPSPGRRATAEGPGRSQQPVRLAHGSVAGAGAAGTFRRHLDLGSRGTHRRFAAHRSGSTADADRRADHTLRRHAGQRRAASRRRWSSHRRRWLAGTGQATRLPAGSGDQGHCRESAGPAARSAAAAAAHRWRPFRHRPPAGHLAAVSVASGRAGDRGEPGHRSVAGSKSRGRLANRR